MFQGAFTIATIYISKFSETSKYMHASRGFHDCTEGVVCIKYFALEY